MHDQESVLENEMHKILWDFKTQTDHIVFVVSTQLVSNNKHEWVQVSLSTH